MTLIPTVRLVDWTPGTHTGVYGGIPTTRTQYVNAVTAGVDNTGATDVTSAIQTLINACPANQYIYFPAGTYKTLAFLSILTQNNITLRGAGESTIFDCRAGIFTHVGPENGFIVPSGATAADMVVSAGLGKGNTTLTIGDTTQLSVGQMVALSEDIDFSVPHASVSQFRYITSQILKISAKTATTITFVTTPLYDDYGAGAVACKITAPASQIEGVGFEDMHITLVNAPAGTDGVIFTQAINCWIKGVRVRFAQNHPFSIDASLFCEIRRCFADARAGGGSNGAGILVGACSGLLIEDNIVYNNFPDMEINRGSSGVFISRNFCLGTDFLDTNHSPNNQFILCEGNAVDGFKSDGYFGGERYATYFNNKSGFVSLYRFNRDSNIIGNVITSALSEDGNAIGLPNFGNTGSSGTADYPTTPWRDWGMTGNIASIVQGTGTGYLVNHGGGYSAGTTAITVDTGTGTILEDDVISFAGSPYRYKVVSFVSNIITISRSSTDVVGLAVSVADNAAITVSSDNGTVSFNSGQLYSYNGFEFQYITINWNSFAFSQRLRIITVSGNIATVIPDSATTPNATALPAVLTAVGIGAGQYSGAFQEFDLGVAATALLKGNRYVNGHLDSLGGDTLPVSLVYTTKPQWLLDAQTELGQTFNLAPFDPVGGTPAGDSDIPAGYRYFFLVAPEQTSASVNSDGNIVSIGCNKPVFVGAGGNGGVTLSGGISLTFLNIVGSSINFTPSRIISEGETLTIAYTQPGNGFEDSNGNDLPSFPSYAVVNASDINTGVVYYGPDQTVTTTDANIGDSGITILQKVIVTVAGNATGVRFYVVGNTFRVPARAVLCDASKNVLSSGTLTAISGVDRWVSINITSQAVTASTTYYVGLQVLGSASDPTLRILPDQVANTSYYDTGVLWSDSIPSQYTHSTGTTTAWAIQLRVISDVVHGNLNATTANVTTLNFV